MTYQPVNTQPRPDVEVAKYLATHPNTAIVQHYNNPNELRGKSYEVPCEYTPKNEEKKLLDSQKNLEKKIENILLNVITHGTNKQDADYLVYSHKIENETSRYNLKVLTARNEPRLLTIEKESKETGNKITFKIEAPFGNIMNTFEGYQGKDLWLRERMYNTSPQSMKETAPWREVENSCYKFNFIKIGDKFIIETPQRIIQLSPSSYALQKSIKIKAGNKNSEVPITNRNKIVQTEMVIGGLYTKTLEEICKILNK